MLPETTLLPNAAISDTGKLIHHLINSSERYFEKTIAFYSEAISEGSKIQSMMSGTLSAHPHRNINSNHNPVTNEPYLTRLLTH